MPSTSNIFLISTILIIHHLLNPFNYSEKVALRGYKVVFQNLVHSLKRRGRDRIVVAILRYPRAYLFLKIWVLVLLQVVAQRCLLAIVDKELAPFIMKFLFGFGAYHRTY